jgi:hypothetical protein
MNFSEDLLRLWAKKYIWWKTPDEACQGGEGRIFLQVMELGEYEDMLKLIEMVDREDLCFLLSHAEAGQLSPRSWAYWHYRLGLAQMPSDIPPLPARKLSPEEKTS